MKKFIPQNGVTSQSQSLSGSKPASDQTSRSVVGRRSFLKGLGATGAVLLPASALLATKAEARNDGFGGKIGKGDASILRFLAVAEILESDLWEQYWELGGTQESDFASTNPATGTAPTPTGGNANYTTALQILDGDMPQYILDNTDDEFSHANFLLAYLKSKGANTSDIDLLVGPHFRTLQGSMATGSNKKGRLTNLTELTNAVDGVYSFADSRRAGLIAKTESFRAANSANKEAWKQSGVVKTLKFYTAEDDHVCQFCSVLDGEEISIDDNFFNSGDTIIGKDGGSMIANYGDIEAPPIHPGCRCYIRPEEISIQ